MMRKLSIFLLLIIIFSCGCSVTYRSYQNRIDVAFTPKEIFDLDVSLQFASSKASEKRQLKKQLAKKGLQIFTGYTRGMLQGMVIPDRQFIASIRSFVNNYRPYVNKNDKEICDVILQALHELDLYLDRVEEAEANGG